MTSTRVMSHAARRFGKYPLVLLAVIIAASPACATSVVQQEFARWKREDKCMADSVVKFPDRSLAAQRSRDAFVDDCFKKLGMPLRNHMAPTDADAPANQVLPSH